MGDKISYVECTVIDAKFQGNIEDFPVHREIPLSQQMYQFLISINVSVSGW